MPVVCRRPRARPGALEKAPVPSRALTCIHCSDLFLAQPCWPHQGSITAKLTPLLVVKLLLRANLLPCRHMHI